MNLYISMFNTSCFNKIETNGPNNDARRTIKHQIIQFAIVPIKDATNVNRNHIKVDFPCLTGVIRGTYKDCRKVSIFLEIIFSLMHFSLLFKDLEFPKCLNV